MSTRTEDERRQPGGGPVTPTRVICQPGEGRRGVCKACGAALVWYRTEAGKWMPMDATPRPSTRVVGRAQWEVFGVPHWTTCTHASTFRRRGARGATP